MIYIQLFFAFVQVGLFSFGGGYAAVPLIQQQIIEENAWISLEEFADLITISEMTPGPIALNCATFVGQQVAGLPGAIVCTAGCILPSVLVVLLLSFLYMKFRNLRLMQGVLTGLRPAIVSMIAAAGMSLLLLALFNAEAGYISFADFRPVEFVLFAASLFLLRKFKLSPIPVIFGSGLIGFGIYMLLKLL